MTEQTPEISAAKRQARETERLSSLVERALAGDRLAREQFETSVGLNAENFSYFASLWSSTSDRPKTLPRLFDPRRDTAGSEVFAYSTAVLPTRWRSHAPFWKYEELNPEWAKTARHATLWIRKMHAGSGTSLHRAGYLSEVQHVSRSHAPETRAKSTDLFVDIAGRSQSLAELQLKQAIAAVERGEYSRIRFQELVSPETIVSIEQLWSLEFDASGISYANYAEGSSRFTRLPPIVQQPIPTLDPDGELTLKRLAPGGHAFFGVQALAELFADEAGNSEDVVLAISNGEDLNAWPDPVLVGWMIENQIPIAMIATEKTAIDLKGGQLVFLGKDEPEELSLVEAAQAKSLGQQELFEKLGVSVGDSTAAFNTNLVLIHRGALRRKLREWIADVGEAAVWSAIRPDLIRNPKVQIDEDGVKREYVQLEGAMGSVFLNLDAMWRRRSREPLVHVLEISKEKRTSFFCPVKTGLDFVLLFHSDRFALEPNGWRLREKNPGRILNMQWPESIRIDLSDLMALTRGWSIADLDELSVRGLWDLSGAQLAGQVQLDNQTADRVVLSEIQEPSRFEDVRVVVDETGVKLFSIHQD